MHAKIELIRSEHVGCFTYLKGFYQDSNCNETAICTVQLYHPNSGQWVKAEEFATALEQAAGAIRRKVRKEIEEEG